MTSAALQMVLVTLVSRRMAASGAGLFFEAIAIFTVASTVGELGADTGLVRTIPRLLTLHRVSDIRVTLALALAPVVVVGVVLAAILYAAAPWAARLVMHGGAVQGASDLRSLAPFLPLASTATVALSATRAFGSMLPYVAIQNIGLPVARVSAVALTLTVATGVVSVPLAWALPLVPALLMGVVALAARLRRLELPTTAARSRTPMPVLASEFWGFAAPRGLGAMFGVLVTWLDVILVGGLASTREAGIYAAASRISIMGAYALYAVGMAIAPQLSALVAAGDKDQAEAVFQLATRWLVAATWPIYLTLAVFAPVVLSVFGAEFVAGRTALAVLCLAQMVNVGTGNVTVVLLMGGRSSWAMANSMVSLSVNVGLNLLLIPRWGMTGAAVAWSASILFNNVAAMVQVWLFMGLRPLGAGYTTLALSAGVCYGGIGLLLRQLGGARVSMLVLAVVVASAVYARLLWGRRQLLELSQLRQALRPRPNSAREFNETGSSCD